MKRQRAVATLGALCLLLLPPTADVVSAATAATNATAANGKRSELSSRQNELRQRIGALTGEIARAEQTKNHVADQLRETESAISDANRRLHELDLERSTVKAQLGELEAHAQRLERQTGNQQKQLARLLNGQFVGGDSDALKMLLAGRDPNQAARDRYFLTQLSRAKAGLIQQLQAAATEKQQLADSARERQSELAAIERQQQEEHRRLTERKKQRQAAISSLAERIKSQRREIDTLKRNDQRLSNLIAGLAKIVASKRSDRNAGKVGTGDTPISPKATKAPTADAAQTRRGTAAKDNDPGAIDGAFAALRGKLRMPVRGQLVGRYGSARAESGAPWKGLFIRAAEGSEVTAVAAGAVVFSDWLRGFGNLLIIDHGDDFLSVYGNNESLLAAVGSTITAGQRVATVGNSGGNPDSGLYFELRHRGQPFDPLKWIGAR